MLLIFLSSIIEKLKSLIKLFAWWLKIADDWKYTKVREVVPYGIGTLFGDLWWISELFFFIIIIS